MTKRELRNVYMRWAREEIEVAELAEAVGSFLGNPEVRASLRQQEGKA